MTRQNMQVFFLRAAAGAGIFAGGLAGVLKGGTIPLVIPVNQWGSGNYSLAVQPENGIVTGPTMCNEQGFAGPDGCDMNQTSSTGDYADGQVLSYTDSAGIHILTNAITAGNAQTTASASDQFFDEITNTTLNTEQFELTFHVDATLTSNANGAALLGIEVGSENAACFAASDCAFEYNVVQSWNYREANDNSTSLDQTFETVQFVLGAGQSTVYVLEMSADAVGFNGGEAATLAQNTLSVTGFTGTDMDGNPLPASDFSSADGANYSSIDTSAAPEPAALLLAGTGLIMLGFHRRRR
jgi:MYXO-CTERM domain-containing protein